MDLRFVARDLSSAAGTVSVPSECEMRKLEEAASRGRSGRVYGEGSNGRSAKEEKCALPKMYRLLHQLADSARLGSGLRKLTLVGSRTELNHDQRAFSAGIMKEWSVGSN